MVKKYILIVSLSATNALANDPISYEEFMKQVNTAQRKIDYSETLIKRSELDSLIIDRKGNTRRKGKEESDEGWLPDSFKGNKSSGDNSSNQTVGGKNKEGRSKPAKEGKATVQKSGDQKGENKQTVATKLKTAPNGGQTKAGSMPKAPTNKQASNKKALGKENLSREVKTVYLPPALAGFDSDEEITNDIYVAIPKKVVTFGIPIGTRIPVELKTGASNAQPGYIQLTVLEDIEGNKKVLPKGSTLFALGRSFPGTSRLHATASKGITIEEHEEFNLNGIVFAEDGQAGFIGEIVSDGRTLERATDAGLYAIGAGIIENVPGADLATSAGKEAAKQVLSENEQESAEENGRVRFIVEAEPQLAELQIEATF